MAKGRKHPKVEGLTALQVAFCRELVQDKELNATKAYLRANPKVKNADTAKTNAARMLSYASVQAYIQHLLSPKEAEEEAGLEITVDRILKEYARIAFADITKAIEVADDEVRVKPFEEMGEDLTAAIAEISVDEIDLPKKGVKRSKKIKVHPKVAALNALAQYMGLNSDFNTAVQALMKYGLKLEQDSSFESGWKVSKVEEK